MTPLISVVLVTYNRAHVLPITIESILAQTQHDFELIICDDCSSDGTQKICEEYAVQDRRVRYFRQPRNLNMPANLNFGITKARSDYVANLHDGDMYREDLLEKWYGALRKYPKAAFVFNEYLTIDASGNIVCHYREPLSELLNGRYFLEKIMFSRWQFDSPVWGTVMGRKSMYESVGLFDERFGMLADVDMWMKLAYKYDVCYVKEPLIQLPSRDTLPSGNPFSYFKTMQTIDQIFLENRKRLYANDLRLLSLELCRHYVFRVLKGIYSMFIFAKRGNLNGALDSLLTCIGRF